MSSTRQSGTSLPVPAQPTSVPYASAPQGYFADTLHVMTRSRRAQRRWPSPRVQHTVIGVVATNARLNKEETNKMAQMAHDGLARAIRPAHTMLDGDTIFALSTGKRRADVNIVGAFAAEALAQAILRAVRSAQPAAGLPGLATSDPPATPELDEE
jgi:L-aminopeptidase/D-esterase-like protein